MLLSTPAARCCRPRTSWSIDRDTGPVSIERKNQERIQRVNAETEVDAQRGGRGRAGAACARSTCRKDFAVGFGNEVEEQASSFRELQLVLILAIVLVYTVMASQYESLRDPFIIIFSIPLAAIGVVGMLLLTGTPFSMQAYIGVIMLAGIVVSNAILLVDYTNTLRHRDKMELRAAIELAGRHRLRPILMTSLCTGLGLVPMALGIGEGAELQAPLARVVIGGLMTSTMITLVFVPAMYTLFEEGWRGVFKKGRCRAALLRSSALIVLPVAGSIQPGATSASGSSTKSRSRNLGCGTTSPGSSITLIPEQNQIQIERARRHRRRPRAPALPLRSPAADRAARARVSVGLARPPRR